MRVAILALLMVGPLVLYVPAASASSGSDTCVLFDEWPTPVQVHEPVSCTFVCDVGEGRLAMTIEATAGRVESECGGTGGAFTLAETPLCFLGGPVQDIDFCTGAVLGDFRQADTGTCTFYPREDRPTFVYLAKCTATWE